MTQYAVIQHKRKQVDLFDRKLDATYFHIKFSRKDKVVFKETTHKNQLPKGYKVKQH